MQEVNQHNEEEGQEPKKKRKSRKILLWFTLIGLSFIVLFQLVFLFYSDQLFGRVIKEIVNQSSDGVYGIRYSDVKFNVFKNEIEFEGFVLESDSVKFKQLLAQDGRSNRLIDLSVPQVSVQGPSIFKLLFNKVLVINEFDIDNPELKMRVYGEFRSGKVGLRNFHEILSQYVSYLKIKDLRVNNASFSIISNNNNTYKALKVNDISTAVDGFVLNKQTESKSDSLLALNNLSLKLGSNSIKIDSLNTLEFDLMSFSTKDSIVSFNNFALRPQEWVNTLNQPEFNFKHFDLKGVDFAKLYFNNNFSSRIILADSGNAHYRVAIKPDSILAWSKINQYFDTISVDQVILLNTQFQFEKTIGKRQPNLHVPIVKMGFNKLLIDSNSFFNNKQNFYSKNIDLNLGQFDIIAKDSSQIITTQSLSLSTLNRELLLFDININPLKETDKAKVEGKIRSVQFFGIDPMLALQKNKFYGRAVLIESPQIKIKQGKIQGEPFSSNALNKMLKKQFRAVDISNVEIENASLNYKNKYGTEVLNVAGGKMFFSDFKTYNSAVPSNKHLLSNWFRAEGSKAFIRLQDNLHIANLYDFKVFSKNGGMYANRVHVHLREGLSDSFLHNTSYIREADFYNASIDGFNMLQLEKNKVLAVDYLEFKGQNSLKVKLAQDSLKSSNALLGINIKEMSIDSLNTEIEVGNNSDLLIKGEGMLIQTCDLLWDTSYASGSVDLYSLIVEGHDFAIDHKLSEQLLAAKQIRINSNYNLAQLNLLNIAPYKKGFNGKNALWYKGSTFRLSGFDIPSYLKSRTLNAENLYVSKPTITYHGLSDGEYKLDQILLNPFDQTKSLFSKAKIDAVRVHDGKLNYTSHVDDKELNYEMNNLLVYLENFAIDSNTTQSDTNIFFSKKAEIEFTDFKQEANDTSMIMSFGAVKLHPHKSKVWIEDMEVRNRKPKGTLGYFAINSDDGVMVNFDFNRFLINRQIKLQKVLFDNPTLTVGLQNKNADNKTFFKYDIPKALTKNYSSIYTDSLVLKDAMFKVNYKEKGKKKITTEAVDGWDVNFQVFRVNKNYDNLDFLYSKAIKAEINNYKKRLADSLNILKIGQLNVDVNRGRIYMDSVQLKPRFSKELYAATFGKQIDRIEIFNQNSSIENFDFENWLYNGSYTADELRLNRTVIGVYTDKTLRENKTTAKPMPQEVFRSLPFQLKIDTTFINNWSISYEEKVSKLLEPGIIYFDQMSGTITHLDNKDTSESNIIKVDIDTKLMENGAVDLFMNIPVYHPDEEFSFVGRMNGMDMREINPLLKSLVSIEIERGKTYGMSFDGRANKFFATGKVDLRYSNLKVNVLNEKGEKKGLKEKLIGIVANNFIIKNSNRLFPKTGKIDYVRNENKSVFNYGAKSLLTGIKESIGLKNNEGVESLAEEESE
ncbi:MAG: hypothetical protein ACPGLV_00555 [Bacteroidia bacterium]